MPLYRFLPPCCIALSLFSPFSAHAEEPSEAARYEQCLLEQVEQHSALRAEDIKSYCYERIYLGQAPSPVRGGEEASPSELRQEDERITRLDDFVLTPHKPNYVLPLSYSFNGNEVPGYEPEEGWDNMEVQFQVSMKFPVWNTIRDSDWSVFASYSVRAAWQAYNKALSSPFRDTDHEPEIWLEHPLDSEFGPLKAQWFRTGFVHQSNGRSVPLSRSWNRLFVETGADIDDVFMSLKLWYRLPEEDKAYDGDPRGDDNPDITDYYGNFEWLTAHRRGDNTVSLLVRNNLDLSDNKGALELSWSFPLNDKLKGYVKYFDGYGETLLDYNRRSSRLSIGFLISDWI